MAQAQSHDLTERLIKFIDAEYRDEIGELAQCWPNEQRSLRIRYDDLYIWDRGVAEDYLDNPDQMREYFEEAVRLYDLPVDIDLSGAHVRVGSLPDDHTHHPGTFSPTDKVGEYLALKGEVSAATGIYSKITEAAFECNRCGTMTYIPQSDNGFQEPHECDGCDRQGPFDVNFDQSEFVDGQELRLQTPPEIASGSGSDIPVFLEDDLTDVVKVGDRVTIAGDLHIRQKTEGKEKTGKFEPYFDGDRIHVNESDETELEISAEEKEYIKNTLAAGEEGDPMELAQESLAPFIFGYDQIKRMLILSVVKGSLVTYPTDDTDRGDFHILLLGDPGTGKSKLIDRIEELAYRSVGISGKGATIAGTTATAKQDKFGGKDWALDPGALVKANGGVACIDELDDMPEDVRAALLEPMSKQHINVNKAGINTQLSTKTAILAAGNPKYGRFDSYEPVQEQFDFDSALLSRFDLIYTIQDQPNEAEDLEIGEHMLMVRDAAKRRENDLEMPDEQQDAIDMPVEEETLQNWLALAKNHPSPVFESMDVLKEMNRSFRNLRGSNGYDDDSPVPVTFRKLEAIVRIAEAAAKFEFSDVITDRHAEIAMEAVGQSMRDYGVDSDGQFDADVQETGQSKSQNDRFKLVEQTVQDLQKSADEGYVPRKEVVEFIQDELGRDYKNGKLHASMDKLLEEGVAIRKGDNGIRFLGRA